MYVTKVASNTGNYMSKILVHVWIVSHFPRCVALASLTQTSKTDPRATYYIHFPVIIA